MLNRYGSKLLFSAGIVICALPWTGTATALIRGICLSLIAGNPWPRKSTLISKWLLQISVVGLGFGVSIGDVIQTGKSSLLYTVVGISCTLALGYGLGRLFRTGRNTSMLISFGTAICGGSAIAAMAPVLKADDDETAIALATVFTLNSAALILFPLIGHVLHLDQNIFGAWAGLAIHDTSSVVGAASAYGTQALATATTVKLTRAIWITPVVIGTAMLRKSKQRTTVPLFIVGFILAATVRSLLPQYAILWNGVTAVAKQCLVVTLFLVGGGLTREVLRKVGVNPLLQGITLWIAVSALTLAALTYIGLA